MGTSTSSPESQRLLDVLRLACRRHNPAEIEFEIDEDHRQFGRMRLLRCDDDSLYIDRPAHKGMALEIPSGTAIVVHFIYESERYAFHSRIQEDCMVRLRGTTSAVPGISLEMPDQIHRQERRTDYRVSLARFTDVSAQVRVDGCTHHTPCFVARLMNISAGGVAAILIDANGHGHSLHRGCRLAIEFDLPRVDRHFSFGASLCHLRRLEGAGFIVGLRYLPEANAAEMRHAVRQLSQFVAKELKKSTVPPGVQSH